MKRNENQSKIVLDDDQKALLAEALYVAAEQYATSAYIARFLGDQAVYELCARKARRMREMFTYSPEVVRVAVTVETPQVVPSYVPSEWAATE